MQAILKGLSGDAPFVCKIMLYNINNCFHFALQSPFFLCIFFRKKIDWPRKFYWQACALKLAGLPAKTRRPTKSPPSQHLLEGVLRRADKSVNKSKTNQIKFWIHNPSFHGLQPIIHMTFFIAWKHCRLSSQCFLKSMPDNFVLLKTLKKRNITMNSSKKTSKSSTE